MKRFTAEQALEVLMDSDSDHSCFDHFEHVHIFIAENILWAVKFSWKSSKMLAVAGNFFLKRWRGKS